MAYRTMLPLEREMYRRGLYDTDRTVDRVLYRARHSWIKRRLRRACGVLRARTAADPRGGTPRTPPKSPHSQP
jgi:hypothetical protein